MRRFWLEQGPCLWPAIPLPISKVYCTWLIKAPLIAKHEQGHCLPAAIMPRSYPVSTLQWSKWQLHRGIDGKPMALGWFALRLGAFYPYKWNSWAICQFWKYISVCKSYLVQIRGRKISGYSNGRRNRLNFYDQSCNSPSRCFHDSKCLSRTWKMSQKKFRIFTRWFSSCLAAFGCLSF